MFETWTWGNERSPLPPDETTARHLDEIAAVLTRAGVRFTRGTRSIVASDVPDAVWSDCDATWHGW